MVTEVMNGPKHVDCSKVIVVLLSLASDLQLCENESESLLITRLARMSGRRIEAILFCAGQGRQIMTYWLSSLHLRVRR